MISAKHISQNDQNKLKSPTIRVQVYDFSCHFWCMQFSEKHVQGGLLHSPANHKQELCRERILHTPVSGE